MPDRIQQKKTVGLGGLNEKQDTLSLTLFPGLLQKSINFEPGLNGGYSRLQGYTKYDTNELAGTGKVLGVDVFNGGVIAARENVSGDSDIYHSTGTGWGTKINSDTRANQGTFRFWTYNWTGTENVIGVDGNYNAFRYDGTTYTLLNGTGAPADPAFVTEFKDHIFLAGQSASNSSLVFSGPADETKWQTIDGGGEIVIGDEIMGLHALRDQLIILCRNSIHRLTGNNLFDFQLQPITERIGCVASDTAVEVAGDLLFLSADGIRTIKSTEDFGGIGLASLTSDIQSRTTDAIGSANIVSVPVKTKSQYRMFYSGASTPVADALGILLGLRKQNDGQIAWEPHTTLGIRASSAASGYVSNVELVVHGSVDDGFVFQQESGNSFNSANVEASIKFVDEDLGDPTIRKRYHRLHTFLRPEGVANIEVKLVLDRGIATIAQPSAFFITQTGGKALWGSAIWDTDLWAGVDAELDKKDLVGSSFLFGVQYATDDTNPPYSIHGYVIEFVGLDRR